MLTSLPLDFAPALAQVRALGFSHADLVGVVDRPTLECEALADSGLLVGCVSVGRGLPEGVTLDAKSPATRRQAVALVQRQLSDAAQLGAGSCYLVPGHDSQPASLDRFGEACAA